MGDITNTKEPYTNLSHPVPAMPKQATLTPTQDIPTTGILLVLCVKGRKVRGLVAVGVST